MAVKAVIEDYQVEHWSRAKALDPAMVKLVKELHGKDKQARFAVENETDTKNVLREVRKVADAENVTARISYAYADDNETVTSVIIRITDRQTRTRKEASEAAA